MKRFTINSLINILISSLIIILCIFLLIIGFYAVIEFDNTEERNENKYTELIPSCDEYRELHPYYSDGDGGLTGLGRLIAFDFIFN